MRNLDEMKESVLSDSEIVEIKTVRSNLQPNVIQVLLTDSEGFQGLGETFYGVSSVEAHIHDVIVPTLKTDRPPAVPEQISALLTGYVGFSGSGSEVRAKSAIDLALWDIAAKRAELPLRNLLAPNAKNSIKSYNTCSGNKYINAESRQSSGNWGLTGQQKPLGDYEDLWAFLNQPAKLAKDLLEAGFTGMKIWPFDLAAEASKDGTEANLDFGLSVLDAIRAEVGMDMELYVELHSLWQINEAERLVSKLEKYSLAWIEDPLRADRTQDLASVRERSSTPIAAGEAAGSGASGYMQMMKHGSMDVMIIDLGWCGGLTDAIPLILESHARGISTSFHDCTGPVSLAVSTQVAVSSPNTTVQEVTRAFWHSWYQVMAVGHPDMNQGSLTLSDSPGHGVTLRESFLNAPGTSVRVSSLRGNK